MPVSSQVMTKREVSYATPIVVDRAFEFESEGIEGAYERTESSPIRAGVSAQPVGRSVPWFGGAAGDLELVPLTKGFGWWLELMLGTVATVGPTDSAYTHTGTSGELNGKSFTLQVNRPHEPSGLDLPFTYSGGKVTEWEIACEAGGLLTATLGLDFATETIVTALATPTYPAAADPFYWTKAAITIGGVSVPLQSISISCDNALKTDKRHLKNSSAKGEPTRAGLREVTFEAVADWSDTTLYARYAAATEAGATAAIVATFTGPTLIGATTFPSLVVTLPAARFDGANPTVSDLEPLQQTLSGKALNHATNGLVSLAYTTADATP